MERITLLTKEKAPQASQESLDTIISLFGKVPNIFKAMAHSGASLKAFLGIAGALKESTITPEINAKISLRIAAINGCEYCLAAHSFSASKVLSKEEIEASKQGKSSDAKAQAAIDFAQAVMKKAGKVSDDEFEKAKNAGFSEAELLEIIAIVTLNFYTNAVNNVAQTKIDFPKV